MGTLIDRFIAWLAKVLEWEEMPSQDHITEVPITPPQAPNLPSKPSNMQTDTSQHLYLKSKECIGLELTPKDEVPDMVACVQNLQEVVRKTTGSYLGTGGALSSTLSFKNFMLTYKSAKRIEWGQELPGDIVVFATGEDNRKHRGVRGHCFVVGKTHWMNHDSYTGLWAPSKTRQNVQDYWVTYCGFPPYVFRLD